MGLDDTIAALKVAHAAERSAWAARGDLQLDLRIAERDGNADEVAAVKARMDNNQTFWHQHYVEADRLRKAAQELICDRYQLDDAAALFGR